MGDAGDGGDRPWLLAAASHLAAISTVYTGAELECASWWAAAPRSSGREIERDRAGDSPSCAESGASKPSLVGSGSSIGERSKWRERVSAASAWCASIGRVGEGVSDHASSSGHGLLSTPLLTYYG